MRARSPCICSERRGGVGGVLLQRGAASGMTSAHLMTVDAPPTLPLRLADLSGSYNIQMTGERGCEVPAFAGTTSKGCEGCSEQGTDARPAPRQPSPQPSPAIGRGNQAVPYPAPPRVRGRGRPRRCTRCRVRRWAWAGRVRCARRAPTCRPLPSRSASRRSRLPCSSPYGR